MGPVRSKLELKHFESIFLERIITNDLQSSNLFIYVILQLSPHELKERSYGPTVLRTVSKTKQKKVNTFFCLLILFKKKKSTYLGADDLLNKTPKWNRRDKIGETVPFNHWKRFAVIIWGERSPLFFLFYCDSNPTTSCFFVACFAWCSFIFFAQYTKLK